LADDEKSDSKKYGIHGFSFLQQDCCHRGSKNLDGLFHCFTPFFLFRKNIIEEMQGIFNRISPAKKSLVAFCLAFFLLTSSTESARITGIETFERSSLPSVKRFFNTLHGGQESRISNKLQSYSKASIESATSSYCKRHIETFEAKMTKSIRGDSTPILTREDDYKKITISLKVLNGLLDESWQNGCFHGVISCHESAKRQGRES
jgi:hypothetical protein